MATAEEAFGKALDGGTAPGERKRLGQQVLKFKGQVDSPAGGAVTSRRSLRVVLTGPLGGAPAFVVERHPPRLMSPYRTVFIAVLQRWPRRPVCSLCPSQNLDSH
jgi:hypothetical protein